MNHIKELQYVIWNEYGVASIHVDSVPVKKTSGGETLWDGTVEVFDLFNHSKATRVYTWTHTTDDPAHSKRHTTVQHVPHPSKLGGNCS